MGILKIIAYVEKKAHMKGKQVVQPEEARKEMLKKIWKQVGFSDKGVSSQTQELVVENPVKLKRKKILKGIRSRKEVEGGRKWSIFCLSSRGGP